MLLKYAKPVIMAVLAVSAAAEAQSVKSNITLPNLPEQVAVNSLANRVYVAVPNYGAQPYDYLTVIDGKKDAVIKNIEIPPIAYAVAVDPFDGLVYVGGSYQDADGVTHNEVVIVDERTDRVLKTVSISTTAGSGIQGLAVDPESGDLFVTNASDSEVDVVRHFQVVNHISTSGQPYGIAVDSLRHSVYVALLSGNVLLIDSRTKEIKETTPFGTSDAGIAFDLKSGDVYATNSVGFPDTGTTGAFGKSASLLSTITVGNFPLGVDVDFFKHTVFVANSGDNTISVINEKTNTVTATLPVSALFLAVNPVTEKIYVAPAANTPVLTVLTEK